MLSAVLIEDDLDSRLALRLLLTQHFHHIHLVAECNTAQEGAHAIAFYQPDLVFLDVALPDKNGFELLSSLPKINFGLIFVSAHAHFADKAFRWSAIDYLVKPITVALLHEAIQKAEAQMHRSVFEKQLQLLLEHVNSLQGVKSLAKLALHTATDIEFVNIGDVVRVESDKNYSTFFLNDKRSITVSRTLGEYEKMLAGTSFMRVQKSHLVNLMYVKKYIKTEGGFLVMADGVQLPVSPLKKDEVMVRLSAGIGE